MYDSDERRWYCIYETAGGAYACIKHRDNASGFGRDIDLSLHEPLPSQELEKVEAEIAGIVRKAEKEYEEEERKREQERGIKRNSYVEDDRKRRAPPPHSSPGKRDSETDYRRPVREIGGSQHRQTASIGSIPSPRKDGPPPKTSWTDQELLAETRAIILRDLRASFSKDLRQRIIPTKIAELTDRRNSEADFGASATAHTATHEVSVKHEKTDDKEPIERPKTPEIATIPSGRSDQVQTQEGGAAPSKLPSFAKFRAGRRNDAKRRDSTASVTGHALRDVLTRDTASPSVVDDDGASIISTDTPAVRHQSSQQPLRKRPISKVASPQSDEDDESGRTMISTTKPRKKVKSSKKAASPLKSRKKTEIVYTSSEEEDEDEKKAAQKKQDIQAAESSTFTDDIAVPEEVQLDKDGDLEQVKGEEKDESASIVALPILPRDVTQPPQTTELYVEEFDILGSGIDVPLGYTNDDERASPRTKRDGLIDGLELPAPDETPTLFPGKEADKGIAAKRALSSANDSRASTPASLDGPQPSHRHKRARIHLSPLSAKHKAILGDPLKLGLADDEEDLYYLRLSLARHRDGKGFHPPDPYQYLLDEDGNLIEPPEGEEEEPEEEEEPPEPKHSTGSAKTEGYYKIPQAEKLTYLSSRNQAVVEASAAAAANAAATSIAVSRLARANARGLVSGLDKHKKATASDADVLQFNQLRTRKKQLRFSRSPIHDWGLYALEHIPAGEMVIEYVGESIRQQVADKREKAYERQGIGSSYLFRVDDDVVIDATMKGNLGRLINHCCTPNCTARILTVGTSKKIVIYAKTAIYEGDEITYDYHFPIEDEKIVCLCGSSGCRGFLN